MKYSVHLTEPAKIDIRNSINYIGNVLKNPTAADRLLSKVESRVASLSVMPERCALVDDPALALQEIRYLIIEKYFAFYQINEVIKSVHILRFLYEKSDWKNILKNDRTRYGEDLLNTTDSSILSDIK